MMEMVLGIRLTRMSLAVVATVVVACPTMSQIAAPKGNNIAVSNTSNSAIQLGHLEHISIDRPTTPFAETAAAVNPRDPNNIVAASILFEHGTMGVAVYTSLDGGKSWIRGKASQDDQTMTHALDPWVTFTEDGIALFSYLSGNPNNFAMSRSTDGGRNWSAPVYVPGGAYDREFVVEDTSGKYRGRIYAVGKININRLNGLPFQAIAISYSSDRGLSFSPPVLSVPPDDREPLLVVAGAVVTRAGKLVIPFTTVIRPQPGDESLHYTLWVTDSNDGGRTFSTPRLITPRVVPTGTALAYGSVPSVAIDHSGGPFDDRVYLTWSLRSENGYSIRMWTSPDAGSTWLPGVTINDNREPAGHVNPAVAVNSNGLIAVAWYDRRDDPNNNCHQLYVSASLDGGATFLQNFRATEAKTCINAPGNWMPGAAGFLSDNPLDAPDRKPIQVLSLSVPVSRFRNAGDTLGLVADLKGSFHAAFIYGPDGVMQLYDRSFVVDRATLPPVVPINGSDISSSVKVEPTEPEVNFVTQTISVQVEVQNVIAKPVQEPLTLVMKQLKSNLTDLRVVNAENQLTGIGAAWKIGKPGDALAPKEKTTPITLKFKFKGDAPELTSELLRMSFRIFAKEP